MSALPDSLLSLDEVALARLRGRSLLLTTDLDDGELGALLDLAAAFAGLDKAGIKTPLLPAELAYALFFDNSTRTKSAWAGAAARLGMAPVIVDGGSTQVAHGETAEETGAMLGMNAHAMGVRHDLVIGEGQSFMREVKQGIDGYLAATEDPRAVPVVNLQCDVDHPTQALADLSYLRERFPEGIAGRKIAVSWAYSPSYAKPLSVPQGLIMLLSRMGARLTLAQPPGYRLLDGPMEAAARQSRASGGSFEVVDSMDAAFEGADIVYPKSWGPHALMMERIAANAAGDSGAMREIEQRALAHNARYTDWICDERRMGRTADALYMHCLPADIGAEVSSGVLDAFRVSLAREANWKVYVIMAFLAASKVDEPAARLREFAAF